MLMVTEKNSKVESFVQKLIKETEGGNINWKEIDNVTYKATIDCKDIHVSRNSKDTVMVIRTMNKDVEYPGAILEKASNYNFDVEVEFVYVTPVSTKLLSTGTGAMIDDNETSKVFSLVNEASKYVFRKAEKELEKIKKQEQEQIDAYINSFEL